MYHSSRLSSIIIVIAKKLILSAFSVYFGILRICFPCFLGIIFIVLHYLFDAQKVPSYLPSHLSSFTPPRRFLPTFLPSLLSSFTPSFTHSLLPFFIPSSTPSSTQKVSSYLPSLLPSLIHYFLSSFLPPLLPPPRKFFLPSFTPFFLHSLLPSLLTSIFLLLLPSLLPFFTPSFTQSLIKTLWHSIILHLLGQKARTVDSIACIVENAAHQGWWAGRAFRGDQCSSCRNSRICESDDLFCKFKALMENHAILQITLQHPRPSPAQIIPPWPCWRRKSNTR